MHKTLDKKLFNLFGPSITDQRVVFLNQKQLEHEVAKQELIHSLDCINHSLNREHGLPELESNLGVPPGVNHFVHLNSSN